MSHALSQFIRVLGIGFILTAGLIMLASMRAWKRERHTGRKLKYRQTHASARALAISSALWAAALVCQLIVQEDPMLRLMFGACIFVFLTLTVLSLYSPQIGRRFRRRMPRPDPDSMIRLSS